MNKIKSINIIFAALAVLFLIVTPKALAAGFPDIKGHWAESEIETLVKQNVIGGYPDGNFYPSKNISRRELAKIAFSLFPAATSLETGKVATFPDYPDVHQGWGLQYLNAAQLFLPGYTDGYFKPDQPATRHEVALLAMLAALVNEDKYKLNYNQLLIEMPAPDSSAWKALTGFKEFKALPQNYQKSTAYFKDDPDKKDFYRYASYFYSNLNPEALMAGLGILKGYGDGTLGLDKPVTRAETVVIINRVFEADFSKADNFVLEPAGTVYRPRTTQADAAGAEQKLSQLGAYYKNQFQDPLYRAKMIYNYMVHSFNYDYEAREGINSYSVQGVPGMMENGKAVEREIAQFYTALATKAGIQAQAVSGRASNAGDSGDHTWVELTIGSDTIEVDPAYGICTGDLFFNNFDYWGQQGYQWEKK